MLLRISYMLLDYFERLCQNFGQKSFFLLKLITMCVVFKVIKFDDVKVDLKQHDNE